MYYPSFPNVSQTNFLHFITIKTLIDQRNEDFHDETNWAGTFTFVYILLYTDWITWAIYYINFSFVGIWVYMSHDMGVK